MSLTELERLLDRWVADPMFRQAVRQDPEEAITRAGFQLDDAEWAAITDTDWTLPDEALRARMSHLSASPPA
ncbi:MAG: Os1348 family NHLP clan protein [Chloroflexota bacterium]|nr:Os1348 family NHLP clan protein [Chloroflexota bacterium]